MINYARNAKNKCVSGIIVHRKVQIIRLRKVRKLWALTTAIDSQGVPCIAP